MHLYCPWYAYYFALRLILSVLNPINRITLNLITFPVFLISGWCGSAGVCVCRWKPATCTVTWSAAGWTSGPISSFPECCSCLRTVFWARICCRRSSCCPAQTWSRSCARCVRDTCPGSPTPSRRPGSQVRLMNTDRALEGVLLRLTCGVLQKDPNFKILSVW